MTKVKHWKPFHAWLNGKPKYPIVLGLTEEDVTRITEAIDLLGVELNPEKWTPLLQRTFNRALRVLDRRNLKPLGDNETGGIFPKWKGDF